MAKRFYNCHAHCFTYDYVPEHFLTNRVAISWLLRRKWLRKLIHETPTSGNFGWWAILIGITTLLFGFDKHKAIKFLNFVKYGDRKTQEDVIKSMQAYYPKSTGLVFLTMDMEYMGAGRPRYSFEKQLEKLEGIKRNPEWQHRIYPFIFCDPRRIQPLLPQESAVDKDFTGEKFTDKLKHYIESGVYQGIKLYPALGYFPFDKRMKSVYDFALANCVPLMTHCTIGPVHFKYKLTEEQRRHPFLNAVLPDCASNQFQVYYSHPLNYECLLNQQLLAKFWGEDAPDYSGLKICLGHWGTAGEWHSYISNAWLETRFRKMQADYPSLELVNWHLDKKNSVHNFSWFTIICDLMRKYPNVYADISFTLNDETLLPLLKMILEVDEVIRKKVLFGTDFYLVSKVICEREFAIKVRAALGTQLFEQIAITNAERYLNNEFSLVPFDFPVSGRQTAIVEDGICNRVVERE